MEYHERIRLLYVACTRACDHLVVSLHRKSRASEPKRTARTNAELLVDGMGALLDELPDATGPEGTVPQVLLEPPAPPPPFDAWFAERAHALDSASRPRTVAATALSDEGVFDAEAEPASGLEKRPLDIDISPWLKGRYGTSVGRAVHGVLQSIDLAGGEGVDALVAAQCEAEAVPEREGNVRSLVEAALSSPSIQEAARCPYWREVYFCAPVEGRLLEGYVDLLYRADDGLVVVDYKTAATSDPAELERRVTLYRNQGASYALGISDTTGEPVMRVMFVFLTPAGAIERQLPALAEAVANVRDLVASGREVLAS
jgi:ATP-dependent helicase/nuclease subunit A